MNSKSSILGILAMAAMMSVGSTKGSRGNEVFENLSDNERKKVVPPNHKEFTIHGITVTALSHKRAIDKVRKIIARKEERS